MNNRLIAAAASIALLAAAPAVSAADVARTSSPASADSELGGGSDGLFIILGVAIIAAFVTITLINDDEGDNPVSA